VENWKHFWTICQNQAGNPKGVIREKLLKFVTGHYPQVNTLIAVDNGWRVFGTQKTA
jgi:hypothetical protein